MGTGESEQINQVQRGNYLLLQPQRPCFSLNGVSQGQSNINTIPTTQYCILYIQGSFIATLSTNYKHSIEKVKTMGIKYL